MEQSNCLVKFCRPEHNILNQCHNIQFGTLEHYRELYPKSGIADRYEGREDILVKFVDSENASPEVKEMFPLLKGKNVTIQRSYQVKMIPNCYIWCCAQVTKPISAEQGKLFDREYTSFYTITNLPLFANRLREILLNFITDSAFPDPWRETLGNFSFGDRAGIQLIIFWGKVFYVDEKISVIDQGEMYHYLQNFPEPLRPLFVKPGKFREDHEVRIAFYFLHQQHGLIPVRKEPLIVSILPIADR